MNKKIVLFVGLLCVLLILYILLSASTTNKNAVTQVTNNDFEQDVTAETTKDIHTFTSTLPENYEEYQVAIDTFVDQLSDLLLYNDPDPEPSINQIIQHLERTGSAITPNDSCLLVASYTYNTVEGQAVAGQFFRDPVSYDEKDINKYMYQLRGYASKRTMNKDFVSGPGGSTIGMATSKDWTCSDVNND